MQILVISDTHGDYQSLNQIITKHPTANLIIHCGDGEEDVMRYRRQNPREARKILMVRGNCDSNSRIPEMLVQPLPFGHRVVAVHGHHYMYGDLADTLSQLAWEQKSDIVLFGHTHVRADKCSGGIHLFNPGSAALPRDGLAPSYGLIDIFESGLLFSHGDVPALFYAD